jgi:hypothetical protein
VRRDDIRAFARATLGVGRAMTRAVVDIFGGESRCEGFRLSLFRRYSTAMLIQSARVRVSNMYERQIKLPFAAFAADG